MLSSLVTSRARAGGCCPADSTWNGLSTALPLYNPDWPLLYCPVLPGVDFTVLPLYYPDCPLFTVMFCPVLAGVASTVLPQYYPDWLIDCIALYPAPICTILPCTALPDPALYWPILSSTTLCWPMTAMASTALLQKQVITCWRSLALLGSLQVARTVQPPACSSSFTRPRPIPLEAPVTRTVLWAILVTTTVWNTKIWQSQYIIKV